MSRTNEPPREWSVYRDGRYVGDVRAKNRQSAREAALVRYFDPRRDIFEEDAALEVSPR